VIPNSHANSVRRLIWAGRRAFTLIELMAVCIIIVILIGLVLGLASSVRRQMNVGTTKATIATLGAAIESYKADWGYFPASTVGRISANGYWEATNNWLLYRALAGTNGRKKYMSFPASIVHTNAGCRSLDGATTVTQYWGAASGFTPCTPGGLVNIYDGFNMPLNYYHSPTTPFAMINNSIIGTNGYDCIGYTVGGQVNVGSYDLFSYGSDRLTYVPGANGIALGNTGTPLGYPWEWPGGPLGGFGSPNRGWPNTNAASDDITNWGR